SIRERWWPWSAGLLGRDAPLIAHAAGRSLEIAPSGPKMALRAIVQNALAYPAASRPRTPTSRPLRLDWRCPMRVRSTRRHAVAILLVLGVSVIAASTASGTAPGRNGKLAFRRYLAADHTGSA